jgi:hypothetical protein
VKEERVEKAHLRVLTVERKLSEETFKKTEKSLKTPVKDYDIDLSNSNT